MPRIRFKLTDELHEVLILALEEARGFGERFIFPQHLLLALLAHEGGGAWGLLSSHGVTLARAREHLLLVDPMTGPYMDDADALRWLGIDVSSVPSHVARELDGAPAQLPVMSDLTHALDARSCRLLNASQDLADGLGSAGVTSLHLLVSLISDPRGNAASVLFDTLGADALQVCKDSLAALGTAPTVAGDLGFEAAIRDRYHPSLHPHAAVRSAGARESAVGLRAVRVLNRIAASLEQAVVAKARSQNWPDTEIDRLLHRDTITDHDRTVRIAFTQAMAAMSDLGERIDELVTRERPLTFATMDSRDRIGQSLERAGYRLLDFSGGSARGWVFTSRSQREAVVFSAMSDPAWPAISSIGTGREVPGWCLAAKESLLSRADELRALQAIC